MELRSRRRLSCSQQQPPPGGGGGGVDRISALPDDLLLLVLASLRCTRAAARTGVLSHRWRGLWACLRQIVFIDVQFPSLEAALGHVDPPAVSLLEIHVPNPFRDNLVPDSTGVNSLLRAAAQLAPEEFVLDISGRSVDVDLSCLHRDTSIMLGSCLLFLPIPAGVDFPALRTMSLSGTVPDLNSLLSCCPRLRTLRLSDANNVGGGLRVSSAWLQELFIVGSFQQKHQVNIVAPMLKQLTMSFICTEVNISVFAPMVEKASWDCWYYKQSIVFGLWRLERVTLHMAERQGHRPSLKICAHATSRVLVTKEDTFAREIEKHMIAEFSVLGLHLTTNGHVFGALLMFHLLGMTRICGSMQRLKAILKNSVVKEECPFDCPCESSNWRSQTVSLSALEEVEINEFKGEDHEFDLLKLVFKCAPLLQK